MSTVWRISAHRPSFSTVHIVFGLVALVGVGSRLVLALAFYGNYDQESYEIVARIMSSGGNVYAETPRYNYSPLWAHLLLVLSRLSEVTGLPYHFVTRAFLTSIDLVNAALVGALTAQVTRRTWLQGFAFYIANPVTVLLTGYHGQFENLAMLPLLAATLLMVGSTRPAATLIWALGTTALIIKHIVVFGVWTLFLYRSATVARASTLLALSGIVFMATFAPYASTGREGVLENVFFYVSRPNVWGPGKLLEPVVSLALFLMVMVCLPVFARPRLRLSTSRAMEMSGVALLASIPGFAVQYLLVPVVFGSIFASPPFWLFTVVATLFLLGARDNLHLWPQFMDVNMVWFTLLIWMAFCLRPHSGTAGERVLSECAVSGDKPDKLKR